MSLLKNNIIFTLLILLVSCASPTYSNKSGVFQNIDLPFVKSSPKFHLSDEFNNNLPDCIAILPIRKSEDIDLNIYAIDIEKLVRHTVYAHISPYQYRDIELSKIDYYYKDSSNLADLSTHVQCDNFISGEIIRFKQQDLKIYSNISIEMDLKLFDTSVSNPLWTSSHRIDTHGGTIPLSPIGIALGLADAAKNLEAEQYVRITDEIVRSMISTLPDNDNLMFAVSIEEENKLLEQDNLIQATFYPDQDNYPSTDIEVRNEDEYRLMLLKDDLPPHQRISIYEQLIKITPDDLQIYNEYNQFLYDRMEYYLVEEKINRMISQNFYNGDTYFLKGRIHLKHNEIDEAEKSFIKSAALNDRNVLAMNALGYVYSMKNKNFKADAAYKMAIETDNKNIFAHLNIGILAMNSGEYDKALVFLETAGVLALQQGEYDQYLMSIKKIESLKKHDLEVESILQELKILEQKIIKEG